MGVKVLKFVERVRMIDMLAGFCGLLSRLWRFLEIFK